jgi:glycolate oxidase iron-sulfur subunit
MNLHLDEDDLAGCVSCGLCLPHCPTWRVTGEEARSPRGRILAMRGVHLDDAPVDEPFLDSMDTCVQCRGCETACPSGVPFGRLMEGTREALADEVGHPGRLRRWAFTLLDRHRLLVAGSRAVAVAQRLRLVPSRLGLPRLPLRQPALESTGDDVWLFTGCVMDAWQRDVHVAVVDVLDAAGVGVRLASGGSCCGALAEHAGLRATATASAERTMRGLPGDRPVLVDAAGCGAMLKDYGHLLGTDEGRAFAARVHDVHEWLAERTEHLPPLARLAPRVAILAPCHLRHAQGAHRAGHDLLSPIAEVVDLDDEGLCCGAGGAFSIEHPGLAADIRARKVAAIHRTGAPVVASANPGCALHLRAAGVSVKHPFELLAEALALRPAEVASASSTIGP